MSDLLSFRTWFEPLLTQSLDAELETFNALHASLEIALHSKNVANLSSSGKRLRPYMGSLGFLASGTPVSTAITPCLIALEHFHTFCLVQDDIIDQSTERRRVDCVHTGIAKHLTLQAQVKTARVTQIAGGEAMLFGDLLLALACKIFASAPADAQAEFYAMVQEVVAGQMIDIETSLFPAVSDELIDKKMYYKTASYTFVRPFRIGLALAGVPKEARETLAAFATPLGLAFQIQDDYLDLAGDPTKTGKAILSDIREGQHTVFSQLFLAQAEPDLKQTFLAAFGNPNVLESDLKTLQIEVLNHPSLTQGLTIMNAHFSKTRDLLHGANLPEPVLKELLQLVDTIAEREA